MKDRDLIRLARDVLTEGEFQVWVYKHARDYGRRRGSVVLGISEDQWRYRIKAADRKVSQALEEAA